MLLNLQFQIEVCPLPSHWLSVEQISQLSNGTMNILRLPLLFSFPSVSLIQDTITISSLLSNLQDDDIDPVV